MTGPNSEQGAVIGIDLGGTKVLAGLFDATDELLHREYVPVSWQNETDLLDGMAAIVGDIKQRLPEGLALRGVGYGIPTTIDQRTGIAVVACNLPITNVPFRDEMTARTGVPAVVDNDANVAALAEQRKGAAQGSRVALAVTLGTGFGGGIVIDGKIFGGSIGAGAELGHMSIDHDGPRCTAPNCAGVGCIEGFCSGTALAREARAYVEAHPTSALATQAADGTAPRGELVVELARHGDAGAIGLLEQLGERLGVGLVNFTNIFNPDAIVVGGGLVAGHEWFLPVAERIVRERALPPGNTQVKIVRAHFGEDAGMVGAALLARDAVTAGADAVRAHRAVASGAR